MKSASLSTCVFHIQSCKSLFVLLIMALLLCSHNVANAQLISTGQLIGAQLNAIQTSVPFLTIAPDGRSSGMGDVGAATSPDVNSQHWNSAKYAFIEGQRGVALTYTPWAINLIPHIYHLYFSGYYNIDHKNTISSSFRYFSLGEVLFGPGGTLPAGDYHPREFAVDAGFSRRFSDHFSGGLVLRYIHSDLTGGSVSPSVDVGKPGTSFAGDLGLYYQNDIQLGEKDAQWALGLNISNLGSPVSYAEDAPATPLPSNLRLGGRFTCHMNENHTLSFHTDLNKLLVPSPPVQELDTLTNELIVVRGKEAPGSVILGMFQSFYDAPGVQRPDRTYSVAREEMYEIIYGLGAEYWYKKQFALRTGYFHEHATKGNREYFTFGLGTRYKSLNYDISYLLPVLGPSSPIFNTFRFSFTVEFGKTSEM